tara:strand:- start:15903 stop:18266 length:2364 start_codon:yes stop_codon:yes gene_type:complete
MSSIDLEGLLGSLNNVKNNWAKESDIAGQVAEKGGEYLVSGIETSMNAVEASLTEARNNLTRESLNKVKADLQGLQSSQSKYVQFKYGLNIYKGINIAGAIVDPETARENVGKILNPGNLAGTVLKGFLGSAIGLGGVVSGISGEETGFDPVGKFVQGIDKRADWLAETPVGQAGEWLAKNTVGRATEGLMKIPLGKAKTYYTTFDDKYTLGPNDGYVPQNSQPDPDGKYTSSTLYGEDAVRAYNSESGEDYDPKSFEYKPELGYNLKVITDGVSDTKKQFSMLNPFAKKDGSEKKLLERIFIPKNWFARLRDEASKGKQEIQNVEDMDAYAQTLGLNSLDPTRMDKASMEKLKVEFNAQVDTNIQDELEAENLKKHFAHMANFSGTPIRLKTYDEPGPGEVPFNANFDGMDSHLDNKFGDFDVEELGLFDENGRPTQALFEYAKEYDREIELYHTGEPSNFGSEAGATPFKILEPSDEYFQSQASDYIRGITAPELKEYDPSSEKDPSTYYFTDPSDDEKLLYYDTEGTDFNQGFDNSLQFNGEVDLNADPNHIGHNWYETDFHGNVYRPQGDSEWMYSQESSTWLYEDPETDWVWEKQAGWLYQSTQEDGSKWLYGDDQQSWISYDKTIDNDINDWDWLTPKKEESAIASYSEEEMKSAWIDDLWYDESDKLKGKLYGMNTESLKQSANFITAGKTDITKMHGWAEKKMNTGFNPGELVFSLSQQAGQQAWNNSKQESLVPGASQDTKSTIPNMDTTVPQQETKSGPIWVPWYEKNIGDINTDWT